MILLLLLASGAEIVIRLAELRSQRPLMPPRPATGSVLTVPTWTTYQELRPLTNATVTVQEGGATEKIRINSFGLRGDKVAVPKPPDVVRVLCLGDEALLGLKLPRDSLFSAQLQNRLQASTRLSVEVWNAGVPGGCPLTEYLLLTHRLAALQPDLVIATVNERDLAEDHAYRRFTRIDADGTPLACRHPSLGRKPRANSLKAWREEFRLVDLGLRWAGDVWRRNTDDEEAFGGDGRLPDLAQLRNDPLTIERMLQPIAAMSRWCRGTAAGLCVVEVVPADAGDAALNETALSPALNAVAESGQFAVVQVNRRARHEEESPGSQWTADEHREFADRVSERILASIPGPWNSPYFRVEPTISPASLETPAAPNYSRPGPTGRRPSGPLRRP